MVAYTKPQQMKKEESQRLRGEINQTKFVDLRYERWQAVMFRKAIYGFFNISSRNASLFIALIVFPLPRICVRLFRDQMGQVVGQKTDSLKCFVEVNLKPEVYGDEQ